MRIHFIGIAGAIMHNLAIALKLQGHTVTGSDFPIYEPAASRLKKHGLFPIWPDWNPDVITQDIDVVILGMTASIDNPELIKARELALHVVTFPQFIAEHAKEKTKVVIAGSHGKTTTTAMVMHILKENNIPHDYLVGSMLPGYDVMVGLSDAPLIIIEGDEYPESRETLVSKCLIYKHDIGVLNGIERDHINVFPTYESYLQAFNNFVGLTPQAGKLFYADSDPEVVKLMEKHPNTPQTGYPVHAYTIIDDVWHLVRQDGSHAPLQIFGKHNMSNLNAAIHVCRELGIADDDIYTAAASFPGTDKRLSKIYHDKDTSNIIYRDFAHAPSKVRATLAAVKEAHPEHTIIACYELHTYSSTSHDFLAHYEHTLDPADHACVYLSAHAFENKGRTMLSGEQVQQGFARNNITICTTPQQLEAFLNEQKTTSNQKNILLMMSSGSFDELKIEW